MSIYKIIEELKSDNSRLFKESVLKREFDNQLLKDVYLATYDGNINYWIKKIPEHTPSGDRDLYWGLTRIKSLADRTYTGSAAQTFLQETLNEMNADDAKVLVLIIGRDLKCSCSDSTANKVWKGLIPETPYQRCSSLDKLKHDKWKDGLISQTKEDGSFLFMTKTFDGVIDLFTRSGSRYDIAKFVNILSDAEYLKSGMVYMGEFLVQVNGVTLPRTTGNGILTSVQKGGDFEPGQIPIITLWDCIPLESFIPKGKYEFPYIHRFEALNEMIQQCIYINLVESKIVYSMDEAMGDYRDKLSRGLEGTILKYKSAYWSDSTSRDMFKLKILADCELEITGFKEGKGKNEATFGSIECTSSCGKLVVNVSGFKDDVRKEFSDNRDKLLGTIITVRYNDIMKPTKEGDNYSLFLPRYIEQRSDKTEADSLERIMEQLNNLIK